MSNYPNQPPQSWVSVVADKYLVSDAKAQQLVQLALVMRQQGIPEPFEPLPRKPREPKEVAVPKLIKRKAPSRAPSVEEETPDVIESEPEASKSTRRKRKPKPPKVDTVAITKASLEKRKAKLMEEAVLIGNKKRLEAVVARRKAKLAKIAQASSKERMEREALREEYSANKERERSKAIRKEIEKHEAMLDRIRKSRDLPEE
jgi:hypothetical protein